MPETLDLHYMAVVRAMIRGRVIPFLGAGVNLCDRPEQETWNAMGSTYLPSGGELSEHLAGEFYYPEQAKGDLVRVSQYVAVMQGLGPLYDTLHEIFDVDYPPTGAHEFFATFLGALREKGYSPRAPLIVTTNYDDLMERAFQTAGEPFDVVSYVAEGKQRGKFLHWRPQGDPILIEKPNEYRGLSLDRRAVILKLHGAVDRVGDQDSFVITEDHYIDYLTRTDITNLIPVTLVARLKRCHFLFLGYSLRDWNLRVILHRIWGEQKLGWKSWAIQREPDTVERKFWRSRDVDIFDVSLTQYVAALKERVEGLPRAGGAQ